MSVVALLARIGVASLCRRGRAHAREIRLLGAGGPTSVTDRHFRLGERDDWDAHWSEYALAAEYNPAQSYRRWLALRLLERISTPRRLLDVGSGQGDLLVDAARRWPGAALLGLEASRRGNELAQAKLPSARFETIDLTVESSRIASLACWASHAVCLEVLEHIDEPVAFIRNWLVYLAPGARLVVTVPGGPMSAFDRRIGHRRHYSPELLRRNLEQAGLRVAATFGAGFPFFNLYRRVIVARGEQLSDDVSRRGGRPSGAARAAMMAFRPLLGMSLPRSAWGTQIVGVAYAPRARGEGAAVSGAPGRAGAARGSAC